MRQVKGRQVKGREVNKVEELFMAVSSKKKYTLGSIISIPLPDGRFAYAKAFKCSTFGVYDLVSNELLPMTDVIRNKFSFYKSSTDLAIKNGEWPVIGAEPFVDEDSAWPPPQATCYLRETNEWTMGGIPRVNERGQMRVATLDEVRGLDIMSVSHRPDLFVKAIVNRLINGNHDEYKVRS
jgi:Immunity protein 26